MAAPITSPQTLPEEPTGAASRAPTTQVPTLVPSCRAEVMTAPTRPGGAPGTAAVVSVAAVLAETAATPKAAMSARLAGAAAAVGARLELRVGAIASLTAIDLCALLERVRLAHPNPSVTVVQKATDKMIGDVRDGRLDLTIVDTARPSDPALESVTVCEEAFCLTGPALPPGPVAPAEVDGRAWVALRRGTRLRGVFDRLMADQHLVPVVAAEVGDIRLLARLSAAGFGNAVLPAPMVLHRPSAPIPSTVLPPRTIRAVHRSRHGNPALSTCLSALSDSAALAG